MRRRSPPRRPRQRGKATLSSPVIGGNWKELDRAAGPTAPPQDFRKRSAACKDFRSTGAGDSYGRKTARPASAPSRQCVSTSMRQRISTSARHASAPK